MKKVENHQFKLKVCNKVDQIIIGDSIVAGFLRYKDIWSKYFPNTLNLGIGGDRTEHILWRINNMKFPSNIKSVIIEVGTNNISKIRPLIYVMEFYAQQNYLS